MWFKLLQVVLRCVRWVFGHLDGFQMFWRVSSCLRSLGCSLVAHVL